MAPDEYRHDEVALDVLWVWPDQPSVGSVYASAHGIDFLVSRIDSLVLIRIEQSRLDCLFPGIVSTAFAIGQETEGT